MSGNIQKVAIVNYGMGNLFSIRNVCERIGLETSVTSSPEEIRLADGIILPGVGAFGGAMKILAELGLVDVLRGEIHGGKPFLGICLGLQLLMSESEEFGRHEGLGIFPGRVVRFPGQTRDARKLKVPHIGWNHTASLSEAERWEYSYLKGLGQGTYFYFVHSYYVIPEDPGIILSMTTYEDVTFCSSIQKDNVFACQFHPERSGREGFQVFKNFANAMKETHERNNSLGSVPTGH